jgi:hypothetical protein
MPRMTDTASHNAGPSSCIEAFLECLEELAHPFREVRVYTPEPLDNDVYLPPFAINVFANARVDALKKRNSRGFE